MKFCLHIYWFTSGIFFRIFWDGRVGAICSFYTESPLLISQPLSIRITWNMLHNITATSLTKNCHNIHCRSYRFSVIVIQNGILSCRNSFQTNLDIDFLLLNFKIICPNKIPVGLCLDVIEWGKFEHCSTSFSYTTRCSKLVHNSFG